MEEFRKGWKTLQPECSQQKPGPDGIKDLGWTFRLCCGADFPTVQPARIHVPGQRQPIHWHKRAAAIYPRLYWYFHVIAVTM
jgi:hypothetical protein